MKRMLLALVLMLAGCDESMDGQNRFHTYDAAGSVQAWPGPSEELPLVPGTVPQGQAAHDAALSTPPPASDALLARGQQRYGIYCAPCHGVDGTGSGIIVARGFPKPESFSSPDLRAADSARLMRAISQGSGRMYGFAEELEPRDRWSIIAYIRALQLADSRSGR
jgi:mono/diheme cytochrome c family protein